MKWIIFLLVSSLLSAPVFAGDQNPIRLGGGITVSSFKARGIGESYLGGNLNGFFASIEYAPVRWAGLEYRYSELHEIQSSDEILDDQDQEAAFQELKLRLSYHIHDQLFVSVKYGHSRWNVEGYTEDRFFEYADGVAPGATVGPWHVDQVGERVFYEGEFSSPVTDISLSYALFPNLELEWTMSMVGDHYFSYRSANFGVFTRF